VSAAFSTLCVEGDTVLTGSCAAVPSHWSSTTSARNPAFAWLVNFFDGFAFSGNKDDTLHVRAVRDGL
jgi:hypothetical protein